MQNNNKEQIKKLLEENPTISNRDIAKNIGVAVGTVQYWLRVLGVRRDRLTQQKLNNTSREKCCIITDNAEQIILGSILGDGSITKHRHPENTKLLLNSCLSITQGKNQEEYIKYKKNLLEAEGIKCHLSFISSEKIKPHYIKGNLVKELGTFILKTQRNVAFNKYRDMFYKNAKFINRYIYKLDSLGLAIWFMDDGFRTKNIFKFCTNCFSLRDLHILQDMLKRNFNINTTLQKTSNKGYYIYIRTESLPTFISLISPYICDTMKYKIQ